MTTAAKRFPLVPSKAPNLPIAPTQYSQQYQDQFNNVLRLYFATIDNFSQPFSSNTGGSFLQFPNGAFHQDGVTTLTAGISNTDTTIPVVSTSAFSTSGSILIGTELITYTGVTSTSFTGCTRGAFGSTKDAHLINAYVSETQAVPSATTALAIQMTSTDESNQVSIDTTDTTKIVHAIAGYYNIQFSVQLLSFDGTIDNVCFWFRYNGTDVENSAGYVSVPAIHGGVAGAAIVSWNIVLPMNAGDYIQLMFASTTGNSVCATYPPGTSPTRPISPAVILTSTFVSALFT